LSSGEDIFRRLQQRQNEAKASREEASAERMRRWQTATLEVLPRYRKSAPILYQGCENLMTAITIKRPKMTGAFKKRPARDKFKIPIWEEGDHTAGWYILSRAYETYSRGDLVRYEHALFLTHDEQFLETSHTLMQLHGDGVLKNGQLLGGAITIIPYSGSPGFVDDGLIANRYLRPKLESFGFDVPSSRHSEASYLRPGAKYFESCFARLFQAAGLEMPTNLHLPEGWD